ncbi:amidase, partial [Coniochaeta sp. 2T2.1]
MTGSLPSWPTVRALSRKPPIKSASIPERLRMPKLNCRDMHEITIAELQHHYDQRHFSCTDYTAYCLERIRVLNPYLEAVIETNPEALAIAKQLDDERLAGTTRGPLHGIPVLIKDNIATKDSMQTTAGSWALLGSVVAKDAFIVSRLRDAGAIILGHANMSEWASLRSERYSTGYSPRGGQTRNPYDLRNSPFGSSSGSAVAVAANLVPVAVGTETDSSIIGPAGANGGVGIKPTVGHTSRAGVIPISENMDTVGSFGRTVADAAAVLDAIAGADDDDAYTTVPERRQPLSYLSYISSSDLLEGARFGLPVKRCWELVSQSCKTLFAAMRRAGAEIVEVDLPSVEERTNPHGTWDWKHGEPAKSEWTVAKVDAYNGINAYLANLVNSPVRSLEDVVNYNINNNGTEGAIPGTVPAFPDGQPKFHEIVASKGVRDTTYHSALAHIQKQTQENGIDAALSYTSTDGKSVKLDALGVGQQYAAQAGYPITTIPIGLDADGIPVGLSLQQTAWGEGELVKWASAIEDLWNRESGWRDVPAFRNLGAKNVPV